MHNYKNAKTKQSFQSPLIQIWIGFSIRYYINYLRINKITDIIRKESNLLKSTDFLKEKDEKELFEKAWD